MKETIIETFKFLVRIDIRKGISRRLYPKLLALLKTYPKSTYAKTSLGIYASGFGNFWWVKDGGQKYGWERTLRSIISNFDCVDNTDVCDCRTFNGRAAKLTRAKEPYWVRCYFYKSNRFLFDNDTPDVVVITVDDVIALLVQTVIDPEDDTKRFKITNYLFIKGAYKFGDGLLKELTNDKALRKP